MNKIYFFISCLLTILITACGGGNSIPTQDEIAALEGKFNDALSRTASNLQNEEVNGITQELVTAYETYAKAKPEDAVSLGYLYRAGEMYEINLNEPAKAIEIFDQIIDKHPDHERAADALFKRAYIYNNTFGDTARARVAYKEFIARYPDHPMSDDAAFEVQNLGKSPEQILNEILEKNKAKQDSAAGDSAASTD